MSRLLCCLCVRRADMGAALSHPQEGEASEGAGLAVAPPTMADVIRERKKKAGGAGLGTLRRRLAAAARRPRDTRPDRGCEHARFIRGVVSSWRLAEVFVLAEELEALAALRDLATQAELAREPAASLAQDLAAAYRLRWWCDVELVGGGGGWSLAAHRAVLAARCTYFRDLLHRYPSGTWRVPLEGAAASLTREELEAALAALYGGGGSTRLCCKWNRGSEGDLDIISGDNTGTCRSSRGCACGGGREGREAATARRLPALLGYTPSALHSDLRYLLDSGEYADCRLVFRVEGGCGSQYGFRAGHELPCHRLVLAARSRYFRSVMSRRGAGAGGCVCVDDNVLPRRFARALLHAAYTDQVDLSLIGRGSGSPASTTSTTTTTTAWSGVGRGSSASTAMLDDAFQLYEIARFLEMAIVVQGCEDAIVEALSADTLPHVLRWAAQAHASHWVHRQAMRYLRDEFPTVMASSASARLPRAALAAALASPFLQASEGQALRALLRWGLQQQHQPREPNVVWHTAHSVRRGARRREVSDAALRETLSSLVTLIRVEHMPPDSELLTQAVRRGILEAPALPEEGSAADAWLGRGPYRPPRCFLPYLDELRALLEHQAAPDLDVARHRRARLTCRIPDTLYMVAAAREGGGAGAGAGAGAEAGAGADAACVPPHVLAALRARRRELAAAPPAARAATLPAADRAATHRQIALRAVREMSLPDACADLLLREDPDPAPPPGPGAGPGPGPDRERSSSGSGEWEPEPRDEPWAEPDCCRSGGGSGGSLRCASGGSLRALSSLHIPTEPGRAGTCRRELPTRPDSAQHRVGGAECGRVPRLSACVPDVAMAPNANTHLLTARDYCQHPPQPEYSPAGVLQLDLGDGATHTPRPGSRALRAAHSAERARQHRDHAQGGCVPPSRSRPDEDDLRAALELSVIRAYSTFHPLGARSAATLPPSYRADLPATAAAYPAVRGRATPVEASLARPRRDDGRVAGGSGSGERREPPPAYRHDYRLEPNYGSSGSGSRGQSPNNYA